MSRGPAATDTSRQMGRGPSRRPRLTAPGRVWLALTTVLLGISIYRNINLLLLLGYLMLGVLVVNALLAGRGLHRLAVRRRIAERIFAGVPCGVEIELTSGPGRPQTGLILEDIGPEQPQRWFLSWLGGGAAVRLEYRVVLRRRGACDWGPVRAVSSYPFGMVQRQRELAAGTEVLVLPALGGVQRALLQPYLRGQGEMRERARGRPHLHPLARGELHGLRSYRSGDNPRLIHWRTTARRGELMVRELEDGPGQALVLVVDPGPLPATVEDAADFERAIELAASLCWEWCRHPGDRLVLALGGAEAQVIDGRTSAGHARATLEALARLEPRTAGPASLVGPLAALSTREAAVVVISVGPSPLVEELAAALRRPVGCLDARECGDYPFYEPPGEGVPPPWE